MYNVNYSIEWPPAFLNLLKYFVAIFSFILPTLKIFNFNLNINASCDPEHFGKVSNFTDCLCSLTRGFVDLC